MTEYDYDASIERLVNRIRTLDQDKWSPTPIKKNLNALSRHLEKSAELLDDMCFDLEEDYDADPKKLDEKGYRLPVEKTRNGRYSETIFSLRELSGLALKSAEQFPNPRERFVLPFAASALLHVVYQCEKRKPTLYDLDPTVIELRRVCEKAGIPRSPERLRGLVSKALEEFDPFDSSFHEDILVYKQ